MSNTPITFDDDLARYSAGIDTEYDDCFEGYCDHCGERDRLEVLSPVYVATPEWHRVERLTHDECRDRFVADNLPAVLVSVRLGSLEVG